MRLNVIYAEDHATSSKSAESAFEDSFMSGRVKVHSGPQTTIRNVVLGFRELGKEISLNDPNVESYDVNLMLFLPGHNWHNSWCKDLLFDPNTPMERFFLHPLVEVRQILSQLQYEKNTEAAESLIQNCNKACFLAETPKQYFRLLKSKTGLVNRIELAPVGFSSELIPEIPYWERSSASLLIKDHNDYDVALRSQHLCDMLEDYQIPYLKFERYGTKKFQQEHWLNHLSQSRMLIAWAVEETHGHTLHEAKALDVPIFTTTPNGMNYFSGKCGLIANENELYAGFEEFVRNCKNKNYSSRAWMLENGLDNSSTCENLIALFSGRSSRFDNWLAGVRKSEAWGA